MYLKLLFAFSFLLIVSCKNEKVVEYNTLREGVDQSVWVEFDSFEANESNNITIKGGEYSIDGGMWSDAETSVEKGSEISIRVKSSEWPNDITMCELILGNDTTYFKILSSNFEVPEKIGEHRNINLGISGPDMESIGGPGKVWSRYNDEAANPERGSAVRNGLIPNIEPLFNAQIRDPVVCVGGDGRYYLTGSTGNDIWHFNDGVELWVSEDLDNWDYMGLVWSFENDATWEKEWRFHNKAVRALWAPEIHYIKNNYFITHSMPPGGRGLLKSSTGKPEGPYINALGDDNYWNSDIDGSLFEDEDGSVYYVYGGGWIAKMNDDMSGLVEEPVKPVIIDPDLDPSHHAPSCFTKRDCQDIGHEGAFMFKRDGLYYLTAADSYEGRYSSMVAVSEDIYGPYRWRHEAVPCGGGTGYFKDNEGQWWCTFFGNDKQAPFREMPAMVKVGFNENGTIYVILD